MLVLSRKKNESIVINNDITVTVVEIRGDKVRLGIEAPLDVAVHRQEVYDAIKAEERGRAEQALPAEDDSLKPPTRVALAACPPVDASAAHESTGGQAASATRNS